MLSSVSRNSSVTPEDVIWSYQRCGDANAPADIIQVAAFANVEMYQEGHHHGTLAQHPDSEMEVGILCGHKRPS